MRLGIVSTNSLVPWGGSEELWAATAERALREGDHVSLWLYCWPGTPARVTQLMGAGASLHLRARHHQNKFRKALVYGAVKTADMRVPTTRLSAFRGLARAELDVLCVSQGDVYSSVRENAMLVRWLRRSRTPYVILCHQASDDEKLLERDRRRTRTFFRGARRVAFVAEGNREAAERQLAVDLPNALIVRNPVNLADRSPAPWPAEERLELAVVARLHVFAKGQDVLFEALSAPEWRGRNWRLSLFGVGWDEGYLRELAAHYGLGERIAFRGQVTDIRRVWERHHVLVLPSRAEGVALALIEAMLFGRPAIVTDVGDHARWVTDGDTGFVAPAPTASTLGAALERAWNARADWEQIGQRARETALRLLAQPPSGEVLDLLRKAAAADRER